MAFSRLVLRALKSEQVVVVERFYLPIEAVLSGFKVCPRLLKHSVRDKNYFRCNATQDGHNVWMAPGFSGA